MQIGVITVDGRQVGVVSWSSDGEISDTFTPDLAGYEPLGRASEHAPGDGPLASRHNLTHHGNSAHLSDRAHHHTSRGGYTPKGEIYHGGEGRPVHQGSAEVDRAIVEAARAHHLDPNTMRSIASIESSMNPASNANRSTQYKGLFQIGRSEWARFGAGGNIYSAHDNAMAAARMFDANRAQFRNRYGRDPTDTELYMMHQQGLGFYTRGAMTNIGGNPYPGMHGAQSHESFEAGWGREVARRKAAFEARTAKSSPEIRPTEPMPPVQPLGIAGNPWQHRRKQRRLRSDEYQQTDSGYGGKEDGKIVRRGNLPDWGYDQPAWKEMRRSDNIEDRRHDDRSFVGKKKRDLDKAIVEGAVEKLKAGDQDFDTPLSHDLGIDSLPKITMQEIYDAEIERQKKLAKDE